MFIHRIKLTNLLSFGSDMPELELKPLNVLIGPNGSGKSNFMRTIWRMAWRQRHGNAERARTIRRTTRLRFSPNWIPEKCSTHHRTRSGLSTSC